MHENVFVWYNFRNGSFWFRPSWLISDNRALIPNTHKNCGETLNYLVGEECLWNMFYGQFVILLNFIKYLLQFRRILSQLNLIHFGSASSIWASFTVSRRKHIHTDTYHWHTVSIFSAHKFYSYFLIVWSFMARECEAMERKRNSISGKFKGRTRKIGS